LTRRDAVSLVVGLIALLGLGYAAGLLVTGPFDGFLHDNIDTPAIRWFADHRSDGWNTFMRVATTLGSGAMLISLTAATAVLAYVATRDIRWTVFFLLCGIGGTLLDKILKPLVGRERPDFDALYEVGGKSFPSGHATGITALWLALLVFAHLRWGRRAIVMWPLALGVVLLVLLTRPYIGVHYPTDVAAGALLSLGWVLLCLRFTRVGSPLTQE
jgi:undecaprenyl-diphosphatase